MICISYNINSFLRFGARKNMKYYNKKYINNSIKTEYYRVLS